MFILFIFIYKILTSEAVDLTIDFDAISQNTKLLIFADSAHCVH